MPSQELLLACAMKRPACGMSAQAKHCMTQSVALPKRIDQGFSPIAPHPQTPDDSAPQQGADMIREFINVYRLYRVCHSRRYALNTAWRIAVQRIPF